MSCCKCSTQNFFCEHPGRSHRCRHKMARCAMGVAALHIPGSNVNWRVKACQVSFISVQTPDSAMPSFAVHPVTYPCLVQVPVDTP